MKHAKHYGMACLLAGLAACATASASSLTYLITTDTYIDKGSSTANFGASGSDKVVISSTPCHTLFQLPADLWSYSADQIASVKVVFYVFSDKTSSYNVSLYALTQSFVEGTKSSSSATADGATWNTYDGVNSWTTAGGDYDSSVSVTATKSGSSGGSTCFTWDITSLLSDPTVASELKNYGAIQTINGTPPTTSPFQAWASFTSSDSTTATDASQYPHIEITLVPEPSFGALALLGGAALGRRFKRQSATHRG